MARLTLDQARALHNNVAVIDLHADTPKLMSELDFDISQRHDRPLPGRLNYVGHVDVPRMRDGGVAAQIFGMWTVPYPERGCAASIHRQLDAMDRAAERFPDDFVWTRTPAEIEAAKERGAIAALAGIEGGQALEGDLANVEVFARRGVRYIGLLHFSANALGYPAKGVGSKNRDRGLTDFGREVVREMNRLGVVVDLAHINRAGFFDALEVGDGPVMVSHTGVVGVHEHWRNIDDEQIRAVADVGGCVGIIFSPRYLGGKGLEPVCDHILHIIDVAGPDVPALGSDFDGFVVPPRGLDDISMMPNLTAALSARGVSDDVLEKILARNALRVLQEIEPRVP